MPETTPKQPPAAETSLPAPRARTIVMLAAALGSSAFLTGWMGAEQEELVVGQVHAPTVFITTPDGSRVSKWLVKDGDLIAANRALATLTTPATEQRIAAQKQTIAALETELRRRKAKAAVEMAWRIRAIDSEILANRLKAADLIQKHYDQQIELHAWRRRVERMPVRVAAAKTPDEIFRPVSYSSRIDFSGPTVTAKQFESARNSAEVTKVQLQLCEDRLTELQNLKESLPTNVRCATGVEETQARLDAAKAALKKLESGSSQPSLRAPAWGTVRILHERSSRQVGEKAAVAKLVDDEHRFLTVTVPSRLLGRFKLGQKVRVRFNDHVKHFGVVEQIGEPSTDSTNVSIVVQPTGRLWPGVPLGSGAKVVVPPEG